MRGRLLILVGLILLIGVVAVVVITSGGLPGSNPPPPADNGGGETGPSVPVVQSGPTPTPISFVRIVIALQNLPRGFRFPDTMEELTNANIVTYYPLVEDVVPFNALRESEGGMEFLLGKFARTDIYREQPVLSNFLVPDMASLANIGSDIAAVMPPDRIAIAVPVDRLTSVAYALRSGDRVDVFVSMLFVDVDEVFQTISPNTITLFNIQPDGTIQFVQGVSGRPDVTSLGPAIIGPSERQRPRLVTQRTIQDALVLWVGDFPLIGDYIGVPPTPTPVPENTDNTGEGGATAPPPTPVPPPDIVTLAVSPQDAVVLLWAIEAKLPLTMALRSATDTSRTQTQAVTLDYVMSTFNIQVPGRRDYTIEPAIRSIRQLLIGNEIGLGSAAPAASQ